MFVFSEYNLLQYTHMKKQELHIVVWKEKKLYVAKFLEIELASQGKTKEVALTNLKEALDLYLEGENIGNLSFPAVENVSTQVLTIH